MTGEIIAPVKRGRLVRSVEMFSERRYVLAAIAFADSLFLLIPPDLLLVPMALVRPKQIWALSLICTAASSLGAVVGYVIGYGLWSLVGARLVDFNFYFSPVQRLSEVQERSRRPRNFHRGNGIRVYRRVPTAGPPAHLHQYRPNAHDPLSLLRDALPLRSSIDTARCRPAGQSFFDPNAA
jgi:hypothetical protein